MIFELYIVLYSGVCRLGERVYKACRSWRYAVRMHSSGLGPYYYYYNMIYDIMVYIYNFTLVYFK